MKILFFCLLGCVLTTPVHAGINLLGNRWLAQYDEVGNLETISDLSFPDWKGAYWIGSVTGGSNQKVKSMSRSLIESEIYSSELEDDADVKPKDLAKLKESYAEVADEEDASVFNTEGWWKSVTWKNKSFAADDLEPKSFALSDIDFSEAASTPEAQALIDSIAFQKNDSGDYDIYWTGDFSLMKTPAKLLVNLHNIKQGYKESLLWDGMFKGIGYLMDLDPEPFSKAIVKTALNRYAHFHNLVMKQHQVMLLEFLAHPEFSSKLMSDDERQTAIHALLYSDTSLFMFWKWFRSSPEAKWKKMCKKDQKNEEKSESWLYDHEPENKSFSEAYSQTPDSWYCLSNRTPSRRTGPLKVLDFAEPDAIQNHRTRSEIAATAVVFTSNFVPVPLVGGILSALYESLVTAREDKKRFDEAKLMVEFEVTPHQPGTWEREINQILAQKVNPLLPTRAEYQRLIQERRSNLGI